MAASQPDHQRASTRCWQTRRAHSRSAVPRRPRPRCRGRRPFPRATCPRRTNPNRQERSLAADSVGPASRRSRGRGATVATPEPDRTRWSARPRAMPSRLSRARSAQRRLRATWREPPNPRRRAVGRPQAISGPGAFTMAWLTPRRTRRVRTPSERARAHLRRQARSPPRRGLLRPRPGGALGTAIHRLRAGRHEMSDARTPAPEGLVHSGSRRPRPRRVARRRRDPSAGPTPPPGLGLPHRRRRTATQGLGPQRAPRVGRSRGPGRGRRTPGRSPLRPPRPQASRKRRRRGWERRHPPDRRRPFITGWRTSAAPTPPPTGPRRDPRPGSPPATTSTSCWRGTKCGDLLKARGLESRVRGEMLRGAQGLRPLRSTRPTLRRAPPRRLGRGRGTLAHRRRTSRRVRRSGCSKRRCRPPLSRSP